MRRLTLALATIATLAIAPTAAARDTRQQFDIATAIAAGKADGTLDGSVQFHFKGARAPAVTDRLGAATTNRKTNAFGKSDARACPVAAPKPANLDFVQAASVPMVGLTAWQALKERIGLRAGQKVFIPAGSGGIGTFAIQLAKVLGASVATTTSTRNVDFVRGLGADEVVDYKQQQFQDVLRDYDAVLGTVKGEVIEQSVGILKPGGRIASLVGPLDAAFARTRGLNVLLRIVFGLMSRKILRLAGKRGVAYSFLFVHPDGGQLAEIGALLESGRLRPVIDKVFPFEQATDALAYLAQGRARGKVVVRLR
jgi:NADPH:quinone reductase-like Zn-dependent oxidoreductase